MRRNAEIDGRRLGSPWRIVAWGFAAALMLLPLLAMQITDEAIWDLADFACAGTLVIGAGVIYELALRRTSSTAYRAAVGVALAAALILIWINLAVGIIGSEDNPANLMYGGVLAISIVGAFNARFQPYGMARALVATALAQALVAAIALVAGWGSASANGPRAIVLLTGFFTALWLASAWLFRKAAQQGAVSATP